MELVKKWLRVNLSITPGEMRALWQIGAQIMANPTGAPTIGGLIRLCIIEAAQARGISVEE